MKVAPIGLAATARPDLRQPARAAQEGDGPVVRKRLTELRQATRAFEAILFQEMLRTMVRSNTQDGFFGKEGGGESLQHLFEKTLSESVGSSGSLGIADVLYRQLAPAVRLEAGLPPPSAPGDGPGGQGGTVRDGPQGIESTADKKDGAVRPENEHEDRRK